MLPLIAAATAAVAILLGAPAHAATVAPEFAPQRLVEQSLLFAAPQTQVVGFDVAGAGTVKILLSDLEWPARLQDLSFIATSATRRELEPRGPGEWSFETTGAGRFFTHVYAVPAGGLGVGSAYLRVDFVPVPLPAAAWLLLAGLAGLGAFARRGRHPVAAA